MSIDIDTFAWIATAMSVIVFLIGVVDLILSWKPKADAKAALGKAAAKAKEVTAVEPEGDLTPQSATLKESWEALANLATALKDLDRSSRLFIVSLALLAVAGVALGLDNVGDAIADAIPQGG